MGKSIEFRAEKQVPEGTIMKIGDLLGVVTFSQSSRVGSGDVWEHEHRFTYDGEVRVKIAKGCNFELGQIAWVNPFSMEEGVFPYDSIYMELASQGPAKGAALIGFVKEPVKNDDELLLDIKGYLMVYKSKTQV